MDPVWRSRFDFFMETNGLTTDGFLQALADVSAENSSIILTYTPECRLVVHSIAMSVLEFYGNLFRMRYMQGNILITYSKLKAFEGETIHRFFFTEAPIQCAEYIATRSNVCFWEYFSQLQNDSAWLKRQYAPMYTREEEIFL